MSTNSNYHDPYCEILGCVVCTEPLRRKSLKKGLEELVKEEANKIISWYCNDGEHEKCNPLYHNCICDCHKEEEG